MLSHPFAFLCRLTICLCGIGVICGSKRNQLSRCIATLLYVEAFDKDTRPGRGNFLGVGAIDKFFQALAAGEDGPHRNLLTIDFYYSARLFEKSAIPTSRLQTVRPHKHTPLNDDGPNTDYPVRFDTGAYAQNLAIANRGNNGFRKTSLAAHFRIHPQITQITQIGKSVT